MLMGDYSGTTRSNEPESIELILGLILELI